MRPLAVLSLLMSLLLVACGTVASQSVDKVTSGQGGSVSLDFTAQTVAGEAFEGSSLAGKPTVFWFWAPWCPTCRGQVDGVTALAERHDGEVSVVGVGGLDDAGAIADFAEEHDMGIPHLQDPDGAVWRHFGITAQSAYVVLDADGVVVAEGSLGDEELAAEVAELVG